jgi:cell division protein FtsQ
MTIDEMERVVPITSRRRWSRRLRHWRRWLAAFGVVAAVTALVWVVFFSTVLAVRTVHVAGTGPEVSQRQVVAAAGVQPGTPLARVDLGAARARVAAIPAVASASVSRSWPHTITIQVTERRPLALIHRDGKWWALDAEAVLFPPAGTRRPDQPIVSVGRTSGPAALRAVASVVGTLPDHLLLSTRRVTASSMDSITLMLKNGSTVRWGSATDSGRKAEVLTALLHHRARSYDVTIPSQPAVSG